MKSRDPVLTGGRDYWDSVNLPVEEFEDRIGAVRGVMDEQRLDALLIYGNGSNDGHVCYVSNLVNKVPHWGIMVVVTADSTLVINERSSRSKPVTEAGTWIDDVRFHGDISKSLPDILGGLNASVTDIGTVGFHAMPCRQRARIDELRNEYNFSECDRALYDLRRHKSQREYDQIKRSARILGEVYGAVLEEYSGEDDEHDLEATADRFARLRGVQDFRFMIANPARTEPHLRPAERYAVKPSDPITIYLATRYEGYWSEIVRTVRFDGNRPYGEGHDNAEALYNEFQESIRAGKHSDEIRKGIRRRVEGSAFDIPPEYTIGNGIGLAIREPPAFDDGTGFELKSGTTLTIRLPLETNDGDGIIVTGDTIVITEDATVSPTRTEPR